MRTYNKQIESNVPMNANINSVPMELKNIFGYSVQAVWSGTPTGTFKLQCSDDPATNLIPADQQPTNWSDITDSPFTVSAAGNYTWNVFDVMYNWVRLVYTDASGGTSAANLVSVVFNAKGQ